MIKTGSIVKNLIAFEPVVVTKMSKLGSMISIAFVGVNSNKANQKVVDQNTFDSLELLTEQGSFNFSGDPTRFCLHAEAERINSAYQFDPLFAVNCSVVDPLPHQVEAVYKYLLPLPQIRFLLADDTGAGKTIMAGLLIKELLMRGLIDRILIVTPGGLTKQWQEDELLFKFNLQFTLVNRAIFSSVPNIFSMSNRLITSIDFIRNEDVNNVLLDTTWDMVIIDEAHKLTAFDYGTRKYVSKRYEAASNLAHRCENLLLLTATPHRGRKDTFKNLLQLVDEDIFASDTLVTERVREVSESGINKFFIRRLKEDMNDWVGNPLYKSRFTKTVQYELTPEEKRLYDKVSEYLLRKREEAQEESNIHVSLALMVMQRRLTSSIYAIKRTLNNRYNALKGLLDELTRNPNLFSQRQKLDLMGMESIDDFDEFDDSERESLETILSDPRKFRLFTTARNIGEIREEANQVKKLVEMAELLYTQRQEEQKFIKLRELLKAEGVLDKNEKLVIFTEHKDTLDYLEDRLRNNGYTVVTIHGGKNVDQRREAQNKFHKESQILIATDAAGEGINLQFCRLMINWDIPWNPNRLEQRMGRIHRYGQKMDVLVFNLVAQNTREGMVMQRLLEKLDLIREQIGSDRVYDVISDIFEKVDLDEIIDALFNNKETKYNEIINSDLKAETVQKIKEQKEKLNHSGIDYKDAKKLKDASDEKRLQPIYIRLFFERAFTQLGGEYVELRQSVYKMKKIPELLARRMKIDYNLTVDIENTYLCFDKQIFLDYQAVGEGGKVLYINPGNPLFDTLVRTVREEYREDMLKGTILVSPDDKDDYFAFFVRSQIADHRKHIHNENIADERLRLVHNMKDGSFGVTSPAKFIDLHPPVQFAKPIIPPGVVNHEQVVQWSFEHITTPQFEETDKRVKDDIEQRKQYIESAFNQLILDITADINDLQSKQILGDGSVQEKIVKKQKRIEDLKSKRVERLRDIEAMKELTMKAPEILGCAYVVPLTQVEFESHYGMSRDDEAELVAMNVAMKYEQSQGWNPIDVSAKNEGYDIRSVNADEMKRYIEVKGRSLDGGIMVSENEMNRLAQLGENAWLYIVIKCKSTPDLYRVQNPAKNLTFEQKSKGVQYFLPMQEWKSKVIKG
jgi:superfamily II DNA or RNA helicase